MAWRRPTGRASATSSGRWSSGWKSHVTRSMSCFGSTHIRVITILKEKVCNFLGGERSLCCVLDVVKLLTRVNGPRPIVCLPEHQYAVHMRCLAVVLRNIGHALGKCLRLCERPSRRERHHKRAHSDV